VRSPARVLGVLNRSPCSPRRSDRRIVAVPCRREVDGQPLNACSIALRGKGLASEDARALAALGFRNGYVALDADAAATAIRSVAETLLAAGIQPYVVAGLPDGRDFGSFLRESDDALVEAFAEAVRLA